ARRSLLFPYTTLFRSDWVIGLGAGGRRSFLFATFAVTDRRYDHSAPQELIGNLRSLIEQSARVAAQVEHQAFEAFRSFLETRQRSEEHTSELQSREKL